MTPQLIGAADAASLLGIHRTTFWLRRKNGRYPEPVITVGNRPLFDEAQIREAKEQELETTA